MRERVSRELRFDGTLCLNHPYTASRTAYVPKRIQITIELEITSGEQISEGPTSIEKVSLSASGLKIQNGDVRGTSRIKDGVIPRIKMPGQPFGTGISYHQLQPEIR